MSDLLSQDEIDALLHGVDDGDIDVEEDSLDPSEARPYDFSSQDRIVRGRMPSLEMVNEERLTLNIKPRPGRTYPIAQSGCFTLPDNKALYIISCSPTTENHPF